MENAFVLELSGGVLVHNQDGLFENFPLPPDVHVQQLSVSFTRIELTFMTA